ncbi:hypothetical protein SNEBB_007488 [Seison nebaliae]|nr:hypothetical protein SNEBB_007488 [Seison nebaliae]
MDDRMKDRLRKMENLSKIICHASDTPLPLHEFIQTYRMLHGDYFRFDRFGFRSAETCLASFNSIRSFRKDDIFYVEAIPFSKNIKEIQKLGTISELEDDIFQPSTINNPNVEEMIMREKCDEIKRNEWKSSNRKEEILKYLSKKKNNYEREKNQSENRQSLIKNESGEETRMYFSFCFNPKDLVSTNCRSLQMNINFNDDLFPKNRSMKTDHIDVNKFQMETWFDGNSMTKSERTKWLNNMSVIMNNQNYKLKEYLGLK